MRVFRANTVGKVRHNGRGGYRAFERGVNYLAGDGCTVNDKDKSRILGPDFSAGPFFMAKIYG